jgi:hypothetical protein
MDQKQTIAKLLHRVAETLERSSSTDLEALLAGGAALVISSANSAPARREGKRKAGAKKHGQPSNKDLAELAMQVRQLGSREDGTNLLKRAELSKKELEALARLMDLPVLRDDDAERLRQKIVEESIGARLNSQAIRGQQSG